jgi:putative peptide zinc metalloprotease protein
LKLPKFSLTARTGVTAVVVATVVGLGGWAFAEGGVPVLSSSTSDTTTTVAGTATVGGSAGGGGDNVAVASNTKDGKTVVAISLKIVQTNGSDAAPANAAVAAASCSDCETVAIALEGVLVAGNPDTFDPANIALAINSDCSNCQTLATAYQEIVQNDTRVRITGEGRKEIASIRKDLDSLRKSGLDILAIQQRVNDDAGRLMAVLQNDVVPIGKPAKSDPSSTTTTAPDGTPTSTTTTVAQTSSTAPTTTTPSTTTTTTAAT